MARLAAAGKTSGHSIPKKLAEELRAKLRALFGTEELRVAVLCLLGLAAALDAKGSPKAGKGIAAILESREILDALGAMNETRGQKVADERLSGKDKLARFLGEGGAAAKMPAPKTDATVKLDGMKFRKKV